jgi:hypothetical protein
MNLSAATNSGAETIEEALFYGNQSPDLARWLIQRRS